MVAYTKKQVKCDRCGCIYEAYEYSFIRMPKDKSIKDDILSRKIYEFSCPDCRHKKRIVYPLSYIDDDKKFIVIADDYSEFLYKRISLAKKYKDFEIYHAKRDLDLSDIIRLKDNNFSPLAGTILKEYTISKFKRFTKDENKPYQVIDSSFSKVSEDELEIELAIYDKERDKVFFPIIKPNYKEYNLSYDSIDKFYQNADKSITSIEYLKKLYLLKKSDNKAKNYNYEFLLLEDRDEEFHKLAFVQPFNEDKFKLGDIVATLNLDKNDDIKIESGRVIKIIHMTDFEYPSEINDLDVATYKIDSFELETVASSNDELHNDELLKLLMKKSLNDEDYEIIYNSKFIVPMFSMIDMDPEDLLNMNIGDTIADAETKLKNNFKMIYKDNKRYLVIYTDQKEVKTDDISMKLIYNFKDVFKIFLQDGFCDGIIFNPETSNLIYENKNLFKILVYRIMTNSELLKVELANFTEKEIEFIGKEKYQTICKVYFENKNPKIIMEEDNLSKKEIDYYLSDGYYRIIQILRCKIIDRL